MACGGCGAPSTRWCGACARELELKPDSPRLIVPRVDPGVPVWSLGAYAGARRTAIVAAKEHGRTDLLAPLSSALRTGLTRLVNWGVVDRPLSVVPAPTRATAARRRGGDPVARMAGAAACQEGVAAVAALRMRGLVRDSVGLSIAQRQRNVAGRVRLRTPVRGAVLLVDDIVTTGATAAESVRVLHRGGADVMGVLALAHA
jgi:predicted amidophosphoribosyltransferase